MSEGCYRSKCDENFVRLDSEGHCESNHWENSVAILEMCFWGLFQHWIYKILWSNMGRLKSLQYRRTSALFCGTDCKCSKCQPVDKKLRRRSDSR